jgi:hypothetical protein
MFLEHITMSEIYMVIGFFLSMYACISNDVISNFRYILKCQQKNAISTICGHLSGQLPL